jgi:hypothetical protein
MKDRLPFKLHQFYDDPFSRGAENKRIPPEEYRKQLEDAVNEGLVSKDYAAEIQSRSPEWGVKHIRQIREREEIIKKMLENPKYGLNEAVLFDLRQRDPSYCLHHLEYLKRREELIEQ